MIINILKILTFIITLVFTYFFANASLSVGEEREKYKPWFIGTGCAALIINMSLFILISIHGVTSL